MWRQTVLITGASSGLGAEMARQLAGRATTSRSAHVVPTGSTRCARRSSPRYPDARVEVRALDVNDHDAVFEVFRGFATDFGRIDRVVVNAGIGKGAPLGTGRFDANRQTAMTNFVAALAQTEAALEIFRAQGAGHLVMVSSMSAMRGMPRACTTYAATKAGVAHLAEGVRAEMHGTPIKVTVLYPGYIALGDERPREEGAALHGRHRAGRARHGRRHREGEAVGARAVVAVGAARVRAQAPAAAAGAPFHGLSPRWGRVRRWSDD